MKKAMGGRCTPVLKDFKSKRRIPKGLLMKRPSGLYPWKSSSRPPGGMEVFRVMSEEMVGCYQLTLVALCNFWQWAPGRTAW